MAEDEQFSLCWNNFNTNLSAGFHESLCRGDLVDVTLAAEGQLVKAHRLVLSVCSPYFRKMFTQMPANQHAFVFLKDVSHAALKDLIQFMYCGEVNVKQDALPAFISTAEALQIKGLTETGEQPSGLQTTAQQTTHIVTASPAKDTTSTTTRITAVPVHHQAATSSSRPSGARIVKTTRPVTSQYKIESADESADEKIVHLQTTPTVQTLKRVAPKTVNPLSIPATKRIKVSTAVAPDPLEAVEPTQIAIDDKDEFITLPIEMNPKNEPHDYDTSGAAGSEVETQDQEQDTAYVEDEAYGEMAKYEESYFTESGDVKAGQSSFGESYSATEHEQSGTEAQDDSYLLIGGHNIETVTFEKSQRGFPILRLRNFRYRREREDEHSSSWRCANKYCKGRLLLAFGGVKRTREHDFCIDKIIKVERLAYDR